MNNQVLTEAMLRDFTAFEHLKIEFSRGINVFIGSNGTGKTHLLKLLYVACDCAGHTSDFGTKLVKAFLPSENRIGRLVNRKPGRGMATADIRAGEVEQLEIEFSTVMQDGNQARVQGNWLEKIECVYIPVKEMLANGPGFRSSYDKRELHFESIYNDILQRAYLSPIRGPYDAWRKELMQVLENTIKGYVQLNGEEFVLSSPSGNLEFTLVAEGHRKLALLLRLIQNGTLQPGSILFWDEPESNLNPELLESIVRLMLTIQRHDVQVFLATHDYSVLKWLSVQKNESDKVRYHSFKEGENGVEVTSTEDYLAIDPNPIRESFNRLYEATLSKELEQS